MMLTYLERKVARRSSAKLLRHSRPTAPIVID
jgi:hypothetical protein